MGYRVEVYVRYLWVDSGNDPNWAKVEEHDIDGLFFDIFDPRVTSIYLANVKAKGYAVGVYMVTNWPQFQGKTPEQIAEIVSARVKEITGAGVTTPSFPKVQFDMEEHDPDKIIRVLRKWRELRPRQDTSWTMESFQGGWMSRDFVYEVVNLKIRVVPQYYKGNMDRVAQDVGLKDMLSAGFPYQLVTGFYDAADLPLFNWDGFAFTMGRLP